MDTIEVIQRTLSYYQSQIDEVYNSPSLKKFVEKKQQSIDIETPIAILMYIHLTEILVNGLQSELIDEAMKSGLISEKNRVRLLIMASTMNPYIVGKPTLAKVITYRKKLEKMGSKYLSAVFR